MRDRRDSGRKSSPAKSLWNRPLLRRGTRLCISSRTGPPSCKASDFAPKNGHGPTNGQPKLRDQLCLLIRKHGLDPYQVKRYAADFCGTEELRGASRELVQSFVTALADEAAKDRAALVCKLNSYGHAEAVKS